MATPAAPSVAAQQETLLEEGQQKKPAAEVVRDQQPLPKEVANQPARTPVQNTARLVQLVEQHVQAQGKVITDLQPKDFASLSKICEEVGITDQMDKVRIQMVIQDRIAKKKKEEQPLAYYFSILSYLPPDFAWHACREKVDITGWGTTTSFSTMNEVGRSRTKTFFYPYSDMTSVRDGQDEKKTKAKCAVVKRAFASLAGQILGAFAVALLIEAAGIRTGSWFLFLPCFFALGALAILLPALHFRRVHPMMTVPGQEDNAKKGCCVRVSMDRRLWIGVYAATVFVWGFGKCFLRSSGATFQALGALFFMTAMTAAALQLLPAKVEEVFTKRLYICLSLTWFLGMSISNCIAMFGWGENGLSTCVAAAATLLPLVSFFANSGHVLSHMDGGDSVRTAVILNFDILFPGSFLFVLGAMFSVGLGAPRKRAPQAPASQAPEGLEQEQRQQAAPESERV